MNEELSALILQSGLSARQLARICSSAGAQSRPMTETTISRQRNGHNRPPATTVMLLRLLGDLRRHYPEAHAAFIEKYGSDV